MCILGGIFSWIILCLCFWALIYGGTMNDDDDDFPPLGGNLVTP